MLFFYSLRTELSTKHEKHISDLKLYYEEEIDQLKNQLNRSKMGYVKRHFLRKNGRNFFNLVKQVVQHVNRWKRLNGLIMRIFVYMMK